MASVTTPNISAAEVVLPCADLAPTIAFFEGLGLRIETIFPADAPTTASLSGYGLALRLAPGEGDPGRLRLTCEGPTRRLVAPNGTIVELVPAAEKAVIPPFEPGFHLVQPDATSAGTGRAGMLYRDLIPGRLGGRYIASHISIPEAGPVPDWVHHHQVRFQFLVCVSGWVRLVYEDQGEPFIFAAGDLILQPPHIRHQVLENSAAFEVVEIACPALHETAADRAMTLPNTASPQPRDWSGQRFLHCRGADQAWEKVPGGEQRSTGLGVASAGGAEAVFLRPDQSPGVNLSDSGAEFQFGFVLSGRGELSANGRHRIGAADAFVLPPGQPARVQSAADPLELLWVTAPKL